jgi:hypothetical protein
MPGPGVSRLMRLNSGEKSAVVTDAPMPMTAVPRAPLAGAATHGLWIADVFLSIAALWLGGFSTMAGHPEALWLGGILVVIGGFLGLVAAGIFCRG